MTHIIQRYGIDCVKKWYFEVWNEPDIGFFDGEMEDYFELYDYTALAVKSVSQELRIGGPATSKCAWIDEFIQHIENGSEVTKHKPVPCDFISTHSYPSDLAFIVGAEGDVQLLNSNIMFELFNGVRKKMDKSTLKSLPLFMGEWNSSAGPYASNHDDKNNAAFIIKTLYELKNVIDGSLYWNLSDIYQEAGFHYTPFHGGYGILNVNSIPKSSYNAFKLLNMTKGNELDIDVEEKREGCGALATVDETEGNMNILLYYYKEPHALDFTPWNVNIEIKNIETQTISYKSYGIIDETGSPYEWWLKLGSPDFLNLEMLKFLMDKSKMEEKEKVMFADREQGVFNLNESLNAGDVLLIRISK